MPHDHDHDKLNDIRRRLFVIEVRQHQDSRRVREILALLKQIISRDQEAVSFDLTADQPVERTK